MMILCKHCSDSVETEESSRLKNSLRDFRPRNEQENPSKHFQVLIRNLRGGGGGVLGYVCWDMFVGICLLGYVCCRSRNLM